MVDFPSVSREQATAAIRKAEESWLSIPACARRESSLGEPRLQIKLGQKLGQIGASACRTNIFSD